MGKFPDMYLNKSYIQKCVSSKLTDCYNIKFLADYWYKKAEVYSVVVNTFGNTAILLNDIDLVAVVGGNEVTNPFMVTEVYFNF